METISSRTFEGQLMSIDNKRFINCEILDCVLEYSGHAVSFEHTRLKGCRYVFFGRARRTVHLLQGFGLMEYDPAEWGEFPVVIH